MFKKRKIEDIKKRKIENIKRPKLENIKRPKLFFYDHTRIDHMNCIKFHPFLFF